MRHADCTDETLMRRFRETLDGDAFRLLAERHYEHALRVADGQLGSRTAAKDAVQEALIRVVRHRRRYDPEKPFSPWFFAILRNVCADFRRKEARYARALRRFADLVLSGQGGDTAWQRAGDLLECVGREDAQLLELRYVQGLSVAETAGRMGCSVEAAKKRFQRAIGRLRAQVPASA